MKRANELQNTPLFSSTDSQNRSRKSLRTTLLSPLVCSVLASLGIFGGISSLFVGLVSVIIHALIPGDTLFDRAGTTFLIVAIPAILIGSIFLDEIHPPK